MDVKVAREQFKILNKFSEEQEFSICSMKTRELKIIKNMITFFISNLKLMQYSLAICLFSPLPASHDAGSSCLACFGFSCIL